MSDASDNESSGIWSVLDQVDASPAQLTRAHSALLRMLGESQRRQARELRLQALDLDAILRGKRDGGPFERIGLDDLRQVHLDAAAAKLKAAQERKSTRVAIGIAVGTGLLNLAVFIAQAVWG